MMNEEKQARRCGNNGAPKCPYSSEDTQIVPCRALVVVFGACFALMALWEVITSWM